MKNREQRVNMFFKKRNRKQGSAAERSAAQEVIRLGVLAKTEDLTDAERELLARSQAISDRALRKQTEGYVPQRPKRPRRQA